MLQRDVSLSRRVYTWLLGPGEDKEKQVAFFKAHGLDLLSRTLLEDMEKLPLSHDMGDAQTPFKIFLSLLDKWEIGETLSESLGVASLQAIYAAAKGPMGSEVSSCSVSY